MVIDVPTAPPRELGSGRCANLIDLSNLRHSAANLWKKKFHVFFDAGVLAAAFTLAYALRSDLQLPPEEVAAWHTQLPFVVLLQLTIAVAMGAYQFVWRCVGMQEVWTFAKAGAIAAVLLLACRWLLPEEFVYGAVPISVIVVATAFAYGGMLGARMLRRLAYERFERPRSPRRRQRYAENTATKKRVLLIGAGRAGKAIAEELRAGGQSDLVVCGFVDDDPGKIGSTVFGLRVLGATGDLPDLVKRHDIDHVIITIASATREQHRRIFEICERIPLKVRVIPGLWELLHDRVQVSRIRDVNVADLLGRPQVELGNEQIGGFLRGRRVLVTGAGGSIGSELARQIAQCQPSRLVLVERAEPALFSIDHELRRAFPDLQISPMLVDISNEKRLHGLFAEHRPEIVIHAAAHKHVPMMETHCAEAVANNVGGTHTIARLSGHYGVEVFTLVSTDKAVRPTSMMGATKRLAELVIQDFDRRFETRYVAVRFGNVLGSNGSVIPIFQDQIRKGAPVTVTHPEMMRYFMTIPEASQLVLEATAMGRGGEIFVLDMGQPVRIVSLAEQMIRLAGFRPYEDIPIEFVGMRPGEKLVEELEIEEEEMSRTRHPKIFIGKIAGLPPGVMLKSVEQLQWLCDAGDAREIRRLVAALLPEARLSSKPETPALISLSRPPLRSSRNVRSSDKRFMHVATDAGGRSEP
jgi:FlaA1/EpsC-like NDP-sugar epimerase